MFNLSGHFESYENTSFCKVNPRRSIVSERCFDVVCDVSEEHKEGSDDEKPEEIDEFDSQNLQSQSSAQIKCPIKDCAFRASRSFLDFHIQSVHESGLDDRGGLTYSNTEEDVAMYIAQRRREFPTRARIEQRAREERQRAERLITAKTETFGKQKRHFLKRKPENKVSIDSVSKQNALSILSSNYGEESNELEDDKEAKNLSNDDSNNKEEKASNYFGLPLPEERRIQKSMSSGTHSMPIHEMQRNRARLMTDHRTRAKRPRLLEMLLADEIRHEKNVVLQCVRFVCNRNFFIQPEVNKEGGGEAQLMNSENKVKVLDNQLKQKSHQNKEVFSEEDEFCNSKQDTEFIL